MDSHINNRSFDRDQGAYVYIIAPVAAESPVKIGIATSPWLRLLDLQCGSPVPLRLVEIYGHDRRSDSAALERRFHQHHAAARLHGEWFDVTVDDANYWLFCETVPA
jgi:hypothetical protein